MLAADRDQLKIVHKLLTRPNILVKSQDSRGQLAVHRVARAKTVQMMQTIDNAPAVDLGHRDDSGSPALSLASYCGILSAVETLLGAGGMSFHFNFLQHKLIYTIPSASGAFLPPEASLAAS